MDTLRRIFESPILTAVKYLFVLMIAVYAYIRVPDPIILAISIIEILLVFFCCNELAWHSRLAASITSSVFLLLASVQLLVLIFANSFATLVMLTNLDSLEDLSGKFLVYGAAALIMLLFICLPQNYIDIPLPETFEHIGGVKSIIFVLFLWEAILVDLNGAAKSPIFAYFDLAFQQAQVVVAENEMKRQPNTTLEFYQAEVKGYRDRPKDLPEKPNIVLIFTEGLSQNIVDDDRKVMPNVAAYQGRSVTFDRYFNHTFATYRGLQGQLFSGYQHNNYDKNTLVSLPQALHQFGYQSAFLNVEGYNREFTTYLNDLGFDEVIDLRDPKQGGPVGDGYSDRLAYEALFDTMEELGKERDPFLLSIYTFGTHATFDSADERFGDGFDTELNKFYDADCQFGTFMKKFEKSDLFDDTLIVFTADHCTYADMYFSEAFPNWKRENIECDMMPLFFYYKGVTPESIDVAGRNTLGLTPTILDFIDVSCENYFLGTSLFGPVSAARDFEFYFNNGSMSSLSTKDGSISIAAGPEAEAVKKRMWSYYAAKRQEPLKPEDVAVEPETTTEGASVAEPAAETAPETAPMAKPETSSETSAKTEPNALPVEGDKAATEAATGTATEAATETRDQTQSEEATEARAEATPRPQASSGGAANPATTDTRNAGVKRDAA